MDEQQATGVRACGRPTKSGKPCKARIYGPDLACAVHATEQDRELAQAYRQGHSDGFREGSAAAGGVAKAQVECLERRVRELEQRLDDAQRFYEVDGDQAVEVDGYAYRWRGDQPLEVGDRVLLPENWLSRLKHGPGPYPGVVTRLGATYRGELFLIVGRVP